MYEEAFKTYKRIYGLFEQAQKKLEKNIGVPICIPGCGKCCESNQIPLSGLEAKQIVSWIKKQKPTFQNKILRLCENWLLEKNERIVVYAGIGTAFLAPDGVDRLMLETSMLLGHSACPLYDSENKKCLIYPIRPMLCRAFGVTRVAGPLICKRPLGKGEFGQYRAYANGVWKEAIDKELAKLKFDSTILQEQGLLPTLIFLEMNPQGFMEHIYHNEIASAKLMMQASPESGFWQTQLDERNDREEEIAFLCNPIPEALPETSEDGESLDGLRKKDFETLIARVK